jgi:hypothetical protein
VAYTFPNIAGSASGIANGVGDRNGNYVTINSSFPTFSYVDTAGRTVIEDSGFAKSPESLTVSGLGEPYTLTWTTLSTPTFTTQITTTYGTCTAPAHISWGTSTRAVSSLTLPNGKSFTYSYDPTKGLVDKITYGMVTHDSRSGTTVGYLAEAGVGPVSAGHESSLNVSTGKVESSNLMLAGLGDHAGVFAGYSGKNSPIQLGGYGEAFGRGGGAYVNVVPGGGCHK